MLAEKSCAADSAAQDACDRRHERAAPHVGRSDEIEALLELGVLRDRERHSVRIRVRTAVGDEGADGGAVALDLELRLESAAPLGKCADDRPSEREVAGTASVSAAPERV